MTKKRATQEANEVAKTGVRMTVTFNPYGEEEAEEERYNYFPSAAASIFYLETVVDVIEAGGN